MGRAGRFRTKRHTEADDAFLSRAECVNDLALLLPELANVANVTHRGPALELQHGSKHGSCNSVQIHALKREGKDQVVPGDLYTIPLLSVQRRGPRVPMREIQDGR